MATPARKFGGYALDNTTNGITVAKWSDRILVESDFADRVRGTAGVLQGQRFGGRQVSLGGSVRGVDADQARTRLDGLLAALANGEQVLQAFTDRGLPCVLDGDVDTDAIDGAGFAAFNWSARLRSRWPTWSKLTPTVDAFTWNTSTQFRTLPANAGTADAWPRLLITEQGAGFTGAQLYLTLASLDIQLSIQGLSLNTGQTVVVDMLEGRLFDGLAAPFDVLGIEGNFWPLSAGGAQTLELQTNLGAPNLGVTVSWQEQYWSA